MSESINFERSIDELEQIVKTLEKGELSLEDSLKQFEKGILLARSCQDILKQAEQTIEHLTLSSDLSTPDDASSTDD